MNRIFNIREEKVESPEHKKWLDRYGKRLSEEKPSSKEKPFDFELAEVKSDTTESTNCSNIDSENFSIVSANSFHLSMKPFIKPIVKTHNKTIEENSNKLRQVTFSLDSESISDSTKNYTKNYQNTKKGKVSIKPIYEDSDEDEKSSDEKIKIWKPKNNKKIPLVQSNFTTKYNLRSRR